MEYRINALYDPEPHCWCCEVLFLDEEDALAHLWITHGERRVKAEITLARAKGQTLPQSATDLIHEVERWTILQTSVPTRPVLPATRTQNNSISSNPRCGT